MTLALALTLGAIVLLSLLMLGTAAVIFLRHGEGVRYVYLEHPETVQEAGEIQRPHAGTVQRTSGIQTRNGDSKEEDPPFFDEHDLAVMEAHLERPEFHGTVVELNGIRTLPDGTVPEVKEKGWFRR